MEDKKIEYFRRFWNDVQKGDHLLIETIDGISKTLYKEGDEYRLQAGGTTSTASFHRARTLVHDMVARILDEERAREQGSKGERQ